MSLVHQALLTMTMISLVASLVLFEDEEAAEKCSAAIDRLRIRLGKTSTYEFHRSRNASVNQSAFFNLLPSLDFTFITVAIRKNNSRRHASYARLAESLVGVLKGKVDNLRIKMDSNPTFYAELRKQLKLAELTNVKLKETKSHSDNLVQLADYVVNLSAKKVKNTKNASEWYRWIAKKQYIFLEITQ
jgi:hypothetical protein